MNTSSTGSLQLPPPEVIPPFVGTDSVFTDRTAGGTTTEISNPDSTSPAEAMTNAVPTPVPATRPDSSTFATVVSVELQPKDTPDRGWPFASSASAEACTEPRRISLNASGMTEMEATICSTVISAVADASPAATLTVNLPLRMAVTSPAESTVATEVSLPDHAMSTPVMACPYWSRMAAANCTVSPRERSVAEAGEIAIVAGTGGSAVPHPPHRHATAAATTARLFNSFRIIQANMS